MPAAYVILRNQAADPQSGRVDPNGFRVYIAKITLTTLIDHFTSLYALQALVYSYQLIKLELLTQSIRQQKLPPHPRFIGIRPGCPCGLGCGKSSGRYLASDKLLSN